MFYSYFQHPNSVCMSYFSHMRLSLFFSFQMFKGSITSLIHAFIPQLFITSTSSTTKLLKDTLDSSGCRNGESKEEESNEESNEESSEGDSYEESD